MTQEERLVEAKRALREAMSRLPFDINNADATRVDVWKKLHAKAETVLKRNSSDPSPYVEAALALKACGDTPLAQLVQGIYKVRTKDKGKD